MKWNSPLFPNFRINAIDVRFHDGVFESSEPYVIAAMAAYEGTYGIERVGSGYTPPADPFDVAMKQRIDDPASAAAGALRAALVPFWAPGETVTAGAVRMTALGLTITRNSDGTTRASYDGTEAALWTVSSGAGGGGGSSVTPVTTVASATGAQAPTLPAHSPIAYDLTLTGNVTITPSGGTAGELGLMRIFLRQDATAGRTVTFASKVEWPGQVPPVFNLSAGKYDVVELETVDGGVTWSGALGKSAVQPVTVPPAPVSLADNPSNTQTILTWADAGNGGSPITGHKLYRGTVSGSLTEVASLGAVSTYTDTGRTNGTTYYYKVSAINALGEGPLSAEFSSTPGRHLSIVTGGASTPSVAGMDAGAGTIDMRALIQMANWVPSGNTFVLSRWGTTALNNREALYIDNLGRLNAAWYNPAGVFQGLPSAATNIAPGDTKWIRALMNPTAGTCTYYLSDDGVTWTQLGSTITGLTTTGQQTSGTAYALTAGQTASATGQFAGKIYKAQLIVGGTSRAAVDYTTASAGAATVVGAQGETWTTISPAAVA